jgi:hypothetical protein
VAHRRNRSCGHSLCGNSWRLHRRCEYRRDRLGHSLMRSPLVMAPRSRINEQPWYPGPRSRISNGRCASGEYTGRVRCQADGDAQVPNVGRYCSGVGDGKLPKLVFPIHSPCLYLVMRCNSTDSTLTSQDRHSDKQWHGISDNVSQDSELLWQHRPGISG